MDIFNTTIGQGERLATYKELLAQREALDNQIDQARQSELADAVGRVKKLIEDFGLTQADVFGGARKARTSVAGRKVPAKYRNPETNETWTGRGRQPKWIQGKDVKDFAIE